MRLTREWSSLWSAALAYYADPGLGAMTQLKVAALEFGASEDRSRSSRAQARHQKRLERERLRLRSGRKAA